MATALQIATLRGRGLSADKVDEFRAAFALFDVDSSGTINVDKLGQVLNDKFGQAYGPEDLAYMLRQFGAEDEVDFPTFALSLHEKMQDPRFNEAFGDAFDLFDAGKSGELTKGDLIDGMFKLGETLTDGEAEEMLKIAKKKDDFVRTMTASMTSAGGAGPMGAGAPAGGGGAGAPAGGTPAAGGSSAGAAAPKPSGGLPPPPGPGGGPRPMAVPSAPSGPPRPPGAAAPPRSPAAAGPRPMGPPVTPKASGASAPKPPAMPAPPG